MDENIEIIETEPTFAPQIVFVDEQNRILGITSADLGVTVYTEYNCSCALTADGFAKYKYESETVVERTEEEIEEDRENQPDPEPSTELIAEMAYVNSELALALIELMEV